MDRFRYYYEIAKKVIINEADEKTTSEPPAEASVAETTAAPAEETPTPDANAGDSTPPSDTGGDDKKNIKNPIDKVADDSIIKKIDEKSLTQLVEQIDILSIKILEKQKRIQTLKEAISFLDKIDDTKPNKYSKEEDYKKINGFLTSKDYDNLSVTNLFGIHNALKENFKTIQKDFKDKKENAKIKELIKISKKASRANFSKNINLLNNQIKKIKNNLNNINQIFNLKNFNKFKISTQKEIKLAQKNASEFIKKLS